jgi:hypothetical protein
MSVDSVKQKNISKTLTLWNFFTIGFGAIIGTGWIFLVGEWIIISGGMVDISVAGNVFAAPGPQACIEAIKMADKGHGVLFVVLNHAGDMLTGNLTMKQVKKLGLNVIKVVTQEDIANAPRSNADDRNAVSIFQFIIYNQVAIFKMDDILIGKSQTFQ